jgi:hypothetical protein
MGIANKFNLKRVTNFDHFPGAYGLEYGSIHYSGFFHLAREHRQRKAGSVNDGYPKILEVMGYAADVVFVAVGNDHAPDPLLVLAQIAGIGQNNIYPMHAIAWEGQAGIHQHQIIAILEYTGVLADFMQSAQGDDPQAGLSFAGIAVVGVGICHRRKENVERERAEGISERTAGCKA